MTIFISKILNPYLNLAIESHLFNTLKSGTHLLLYTNTPCVVIGRNQNPWRECDLNRLDKLDLQLIRRRSGGGTVVHDEGNVNFSVLMPRDQFDRDKHAFMIAESINKHCGTSLSVNIRHDIVDGEARKVSGSAFKISRQRCYHHGTMLLSSDLSRLSSALKSPQGTITGAGVQSVKSPVANIGISKGLFIEAVTKGFADLYGTQKKVTFEDSNTLEPEVYDEAETLKSWEWKFGQTPNFVHEWSDGQVFEVSKGLIKTVNGDIDGTLCGKRYNEIF